MLFDKQKVVTSQSAADGVDLAEGSEQVCPHPPGRQRHSVVEQHMEFRTAGKKTANDTAMFW